MIPVLDPSLVPPTWQMPPATASSSSSGSPSKYQQHDGRRRSHHVQAHASSSSSRRAVLAQNLNHQGCVVGAGATSTSQHANLLSQRRKKKQLIHKDSDVILKDDDGSEDGHKFDDNDTDSTMEETNYTSDNSGGSAGDANTMTTMHHRHHDNHHQQQTHEEQDHQNYYGRHRPQHHHHDPQSSSSYDYNSSSHNNYNDSRHANDRTNDEYHQKNKKNFGLPNFLQWNNRQDSHHTTTTGIHYYHTADNNNNSNSNILGGGRRRNCDLSKNKDYNNIREKNGYHDDDDISFDPEDNYDADDDNTKKWRSSVYINLKTMSYRRRWLLGAWFVSCVVISNLLWQATYQESVLESFDIDSSLVYGWLGLPVLKPLDVCFVTAQYTSSVDKKDNLVNLKQEAPQLFNKRLSKYFHYFAFTNQKVLIDSSSSSSSSNDGRSENDDSDDNGWTVIVHPMYNFKRFITQSRWPKFQGYKHEVLQQSNCQVVFYMDGTVLPRGTVHQFQAEARRILNSDVGLSQEVHPFGGGVSGEMERCRLKSKDVEENLNATWTWLNEQPDFVDQCTLYQNTFFGYAVNSTSWNQASDFAWNRFSLEVDSWRDQPLWCYTLHHFHTKPLIISRVLFEYQGKRRGKGKHTYGKEAATAAHDFLHKKETPAPRSRTERAQDEKEHQESVLRKALKKRRTSRVSGAVAGDKETKEERIERQRQRIERARKRNALRQSAAG